jgi:N,N'-diacetyllegionaminate synthase
MTKIIAEIGWNHCGDMSVAKKMAKAAHDSGATYAKYQTWSVKRLKPGSWDQDGRRQIYEKAELSKKDHIDLITYCNQIGISFLSSVFSIADASLLKQIGCKEVKIPSFESRNKELLEYCNKNFKTIYMSTGTSKFEEIKQMISKNIDIDKLYLLHCVSSYPCDYKIANLPRMNKLKELGCRVGYSDHIMGVESAKVAICEGAEVIEKHFTIDRDLPGRDNKFAILPHEMKNLSDFIKNRDLMMNYITEDHQACEEDSRNNYTGRFNG